MTKLPVFMGTALPDAPSTDTVYCLLPNNSTDAFYRERVDRNIGWITESEQEQLRHSTIGIAGCGGMGGLLGAIFVRLGVGEVRIADIETFDVSNMNRQFAALRSTVGKSKAFETARLIRAVSDDTTLVVYPQGITRETVLPFLIGCDAICDEIEFWALGARLLLHQEARSLGISLFNCNTVGFGTRLFRFDPDGYTAERAVGLSVEEAYVLQNALQKKTASREQIRTLMERMFAAFVPELPEYCPDNIQDSTVAMVHRRLLEEQRAPIIATNPPMATGLLADHVLLHLLRMSTTRRNVVLPPSAPGYLYFDVAHFDARVVRRTEVLHVQP